MAVAGAMDIVAFDFHVAEKQGGGWSFRCQADGRDSDEGVLDLDLTPGGQLWLAIDRIKKNTCVNDDLRFVGAELWQKLVSGEPGKFFLQRREEKRSSSYFHLRLNLPPALHQLPWETLYDQKTGFLVTNFQHSILRAPPAGIEMPAFEPRASGPLKVLLIIPERSKLPSIDHEVQNLQNIADESSQVVEIARLTGRVNSDQLNEHLTDQSWDVVHYIGHGDIDSEDQVTIRFYNEDGSELMMEAENFATHFTKAKVRLVLLNCCLGDSSSERRSLSGLGPFLIRKRVPSVVAMRYEIPDSAATKFSKFFYQQLLAQKTMGRVDLAVDYAREALYRNQQSTGTRSFVTPVLYLAPGWQRLFELEPLPGNRPPSPILSGSRPSAPVVSVPADLLQALKERRCIVVAGPSILTAGAVRSQPPPPGPCELAEFLANDPEDPYPNPDDLKLCECDRQWLSNQMLQWICGHRARDQRRGELIAAIQKTYDRVPLPESVRNIAEWRVPALFYTFFDGLLENACGSSRSSPTWQVFNSVPHKVSVPEDTSAMRMLVLVRGTVCEDDSLVLTDEDHERLWDQIAEMDRKLDAKVKRAKHCVLFLGVDPRDPLIHRLGQQILESGPNRKQGPTYFVCPSHTVTDNVYWSKYRVQWIHESLDAVLPLLTQSAQ
jgi:hypothetical protein